MRGIAQRGGVILGVVKRLFEPFVQANSSTTKMNFGGTALPTKPGPSADALFDDSTYRDLFTGAEAEGKEWLDRYLESAASTTKHLRDSIASENREALVAMAHRLAGSSLSAGAVRLGMLSRALEQTALDGPPSELQDFGTRIIAEFNATRDEIRRFLATRSWLAP
jgi:HPt (histidine-containing phosphotransfer) domain-containing protein